MINNKIQQVLTDLGDAKDDLTALLDDIWLEIDHTNPESIPRDTQRYIGMRAAATTFRKACDDLIAKLQSFQPPLPTVPSAVVQPTNASTHEWFAGAERITLRQSWTYRRPSGFTLRSTQYPWLNTWSSVYERLLTLLRDSDPKLFESLPDRAEFISNRNNPYISRDKTKLRDALKVSEAVFVETNLNANLIRDNIANVLRVFSVGDSEISFFLRK